MIKYQSLLKAITIVMAFGVLKGQEFGNHKILLAPAIKQASQLNEKAFYNAIISEYQSSERDKDFLEEYAHNCLIARKKALHNNLEYDEMEEGEKYLERLIKEVLIGYPLKHPLKVKLIRDASMNASAHEDGLYM